MGSKVRTRGTGNRFLPAIAALPADVVDVAPVDGVVVALEEDRNLGAAENLGVLDGPAHSSNEEVRSI